MRRLIFLSLIVIFTQCKSTHEYNFTNTWEFLGPDEKPLEDRRMNATGIGPVEFVRASTTKQGWLLAGSINGGLFYSSDGGEQWVNAGSDAWHYSTCGWAEFHPEDENIWFASSCETNDNGQPGQLGHHGGIYRTRNAGLDWELVADKDDFIGSEYLAIYGFRFHPNKPNTLYVFTAEGLYMTTDCNADEIRWERVTNLAGWIFDIAFTDKHMFISQMQYGKWNVYTAPIGNLKTLEKVQFVEDFKQEILGITFERYGDQMLILTNYVKQSDVLHAYSAETKKSEQVLKNQRVIFGRGRTIAVSPYRPEELMLGYGTTMKRWQINEKANTPRLKGGYHVDLEDIEYDPFDSMKIYLATHGGVYTSSDHGASWQSTSKGIGIAEVEGTAVSQMDPNFIAIGCFHDGSSLRADWEKNGVYKWKNINGGDGLIPLMPRNDVSMVYTSNQYTGGGMYVSKDSGKTSVNIHNMKRVSTSGWQMTGALHPENQNVLFFNYAIRRGEGKGNVEIGRTITPEERDTVDRITDFKTSHNIERYSVYGIFTSRQYPDEMYIHLIEFTKDKDGKPLNVHRVFRTYDSTAPAEEVRASWIEVEIPRSDWIACIAPDAKSSDRLYIAYVAGIAGTELTTKDYGLIYNINYQSGSGDIVTQVDITNNLPYCLTGRYNLISDGAGGLFFGTRLGLYYAGKQTLKGRGDWSEVGFSLPHCKIHGIHFNKKENSLTIGMYGRGVWRYYL